MATVTVVILVAGGGHAGDPQPSQPLREGDGTPLIEKVCRQIDFADRVIAVVEAPRAGETGIGGIISDLRPDAEIVLVPGPTAGTACSALLAVDHIDQERELLLLDANEFIEIDCADAIETFRVRGLDVGTIVFPSLHRRYCYVCLDAGDLVAEVSERKPAGRHAIAGFLWYRRAGDFITAAIDTVRARIEINGQCDVCLTLNEMIMLGKRVGVLKIDRTAYHLPFTEAETVPIRLMQTPTTCRVSRRTAGKGNRSRIEE